MHLEPLGAYSNKFKKLEELPGGANVVIPNDATNGGRALLLLAKAGLIKLKDSNNILSTVKDISENSKDLKFRELEAATIPRVLTQVDPGADQHQLRPGSQAGPVQGRPGDRRQGLALREHPGGPS